MKLDQMTIVNFRCFAKLKISFDSRLTVIHGSNGVGKTAILDAIAIGFGRYLTKLPEIPGRGIKDTDSRVANGETPEAVTLLSWSAKISNLGTTTKIFQDSPRPGKFVDWTLFKKNQRAAPLSKIVSELLGSLESKASDYRGLDKFTEVLVSAETAQEDYFLPVIAYYGTNRAVRDDIQRIGRRKIHRFDALLDALEPNSRFRAAAEWFHTMEDLERREKEARRDFDWRSPDLELVRDAVSRMLSTENATYERLRTKAGPRRFVIDCKTLDGNIRTLRVSQLSDGYRVVLGLVMDLARRMAQANKPNTMIDDEVIESQLDLPAIALIDEVDLHLHPAWQQRVLSDLARTFTNTQFIVTTHSAQVLSTVKRENIRTIELNSNGEGSSEMPLTATYGIPSGDVLHGVMGVDQQAPIKEKPRLDELTSLVDQGFYQSEAVLKLTNELTEALGATHPQLLRLQRSQKRQEALKG